MADTQEAGLQKAQERFDKACNSMRAMRNTLDGLLRAHEGQRLSSVENFVRIRQEMRDTLYEDVRDVVDKMMKEGSLIKDDLK